MATKKSPKKFPIVGELIPAQFLRIKTHRWLHKVCVACKLVGVNVGVALKSEVRRQKLRRAACLVLAGMQAPGVGFSKAMYQISLADDGAALAGRGVMADPEELPFMPLTTPANSRFGVAIRNAAARGYETRVWQVPAKGHIA